MAQPSGAAVVQAQSPLSTADVRLVRAAAESDQLEGTAIIEVA